MSVKASTWAWEMPFKGNEKLVLLALADHTNDEGKCWPHIETLAEKCGISRSAVIDHLKNLHELKIFSKETLYDNFGKKKGNVYTLDLTLSPDLLRSKLLRTDLLGSKNTATKSRFTPSLSPDSGPHIIEPSMNHKEPSYILTHPSDGPLNRPTFDPVQFENFWKSYPRKVKKKKAKSIWIKNKLDEYAKKIISDVENRKTNHAEWLEGFIPHPTTYLNGELWNDEIISPQQSQAPPKHKDKLLEANDRAAEEFLKRTGGL